MRSTSYIKHLALAAAVLLAAVPRIARAQDNAPDPEDLKRGVARISLMNGDVSVRRGDSGEWVAGVINAPLLTGDRIATGQNSRAELQFDSANVLRIGGNAEVRIADLESAAVRLELARGTVTFRVLRESQSNVELATPSVSVKPVKEGSFRITVNEAGESEITARAGDVEVFTPKGSQWIYAGQTMMARGSASDPEFQMVSGIAIDDWDHWNENRDRSEMQSTSAQYVPQGVYGTEDLDNNGTWVNTSDYGYVWRPTVSPGWAPYRYGRWVWLNWYGWTWVSDDSWGWAPYHYGRWYFDVGFGWCWYPGGFGYHHYWSPALVGFFGFGRGGGVGFGFGNVGWVPLGPHERFDRWWGRGAGGFRQNVNITNVNVTNVYRNARVNGAVSSINAEDFRGGRFNNIQRMNGAQIGQAGLIHGQMPQATGATRRFSDRQVASVPRTNENLRFYSRQGISPSQTRPTGQGNAQQNGGRRFGAPAATGNTNTNRGAQSVPNNQAPAGNNNGLRRFGEPGANDRPPAAQQRNNNNWNTFGGSSAAPQRAPYNPPARTENNQNPGRVYQQPGSNAPRQAPAQQPSYNVPRQAPAQQPSYNAPRYNPPGNNAPRSAPAPSYSAPRSAPAPSAPRSAPSGGGGGGSRPSGGGGGGGARSSSGGGGGHSGGRK